MIERGDLATPRYGWIGYQMLSRVHTVALRLPIFKEVQSNCAKNSISASDSSMAENPIKAWAIHTPSLSRRG